MYDNGYSTGCMPKGSSKFKFSLMLILEMYMYLINYSHYQRLHRFINNSIQLTNSCVDVYKCINSGCNSAMRASIERSRSVRREEAFVITPQAEILITNPCQGSFLLFYDISKQYNSVKTSH